MFEGSCVALVTPFKNGVVDEKKLAELVEFQISGGTSTIVPCGTTGESATMSHKEHGRVIDLVVKFARKRCLVMAGTGSNSTTEAIALTKHAQEAGADGALLVVPYYNKPTPRGLIEHFRAVARAVSLPQVLYNIPGRTGLNMLPATVIELARSEKNIVGIKEASGGTDQAREIVQALGPKFDVLSGDDALTPAMYGVGGKGVVSVIANIIPKDVVALCEALKKGDTQKAQELHARMTPLTKALFLETNPIPVKTAVEWLGLCSGELRLPLCPMEETAKQKLVKAMKAYGLSEAPSVRG